MQEKDIKEQLNQELDKMAPDILEKVLAKPIEPIESEEDLFNNEPLFEEKKDKGKYLWIPQVIAVVACLVLVAVCHQFGLSLTLHQRHRIQRWLQLLQLQ